MNLQATVKGIAALGGIRPDSHITARPVTATKAGPVAHYFAGVIEGCSTLRVGYSDLSLSSTLTGQHTPNKNAVNSANGGTATDRSGKTICHALISVLGAEKAGARRSRSLFFL